MPTNATAGKPSLMSVDHALATILAGLQPTAAETRPIATALGYRLAADLTACLTLPPQAVSAMDGYAVRAADVGTLPVELTRIGESAAGHPWPGKIGAGAAVRVFTGAAIPDGADTIAIQEDVDPAPETDGVTITVRAVEPPGRYIRPAGLDVTAGTVILEAGQLMSARAIGLAVAAGLTEATVHRKPRIGILSTGDELVPPGQRPGPGQIISSNASFLCAFVESFGAIPVDLGIAPDRPGAMLDAIRRTPEMGLPPLDLIVTSGGASVGTHDHVIDDIAGESQHGASGVNFWKIAMRPGKPLISGYIDNIPLIGLPGNPVSTAVCAMVFLRPALAHLAGGNDRAPCFAMALDSDLDENDQRQDYIRAVIIEKQGRQTVQPAPRQDSSMMSVLTGATALIVRPPFDPARKVGEMVSVMPIPPLT